jgi:Cytochrome oxidase maturation protein cbb3-type
MNDFFYLIPIALVLGAAGLLVFLWSLRRDNTRISTAQPNASCSTMTFP